MLSIYPNVIWQLFSPVINYKLIVITCNFGRSKSTKMKSAQNTEIASVRKQFKQMDKMINSPDVRPTGQGTSYLGLPTSSMLRPLHQGCPLLLCVFQVRIIRYSAMMSPLLYTNFCIYHHHQSSMRSSSSTAVYDH